MDNVGQFRARLLAAIAATAPVIGCERQPPASAVTPVAAQTDSGGAAMDASGNNVVVEDAPAADNTSPAPDNTSPAPDASLATDASLALAPRPRPTCPGRQRTSRECMSAATSVHRVRHPPGLMRQEEANPVPPGAIGANGCAAARYVTNGCCISATALESSGGQCCYTFCGNSCCGRPLVVDDAPRLAPVSQRISQWNDALADERSPSLDRATRDALAFAWLDDARLEHGSVGAFARVTLELLALGAPPELIEGSQRAGLDEVNHGRLCFALASRYAERPQGPGKLAFGAIRDDRTLEDVALDAVVHGCVGETVSALLAAEQARVASDPAAKRALETIARDEATHAELSWKLVRWMLSEAPSLRGPLREAFARAPLPRPAPVPSSVDPATWNAHGRLTDAQVNQVLRDTRAGVLAPCADALFAA